MGFVSVFGVREPPPLNCEHRTPSPDTLKNNSIMKNIMLLLSIGLLGIVACDQAPAPSEQALQRTKENTTVFEDKAVTDANRSVEAFGKVMESFEKGDKEAVARHLQDGIDALANEGKGMEGGVKIKLERAIKRLERLRMEYLQGQVTTADDLMNAISEAELDVPHKLLSGYSEEEVEPQEN